MTTSTTRAALACALLATTCLSAPALAQTAQPSVHKNIDGNGVDLTDGSFNFSLTEGSIGTGEGALAMARTFGRSGWTDGLPGRLHRTLSSTNNRISLTFGNRLEQFQMVSGVWTPDTGNGATLTGSGSDYTYRTAEGVEVTYGVGGPLPGPSGGGGIQFCMDDSSGECDLLPLSVKQPNGRSITLHWTTAQVSQDVDPTIGGTFNYFPRLTSVTNESAYLMKIRYAVDGYGPAGPPPEWFRRTGVRFVNTTVEACDPAADDCVGLTQSWPTVTYAQPSPGVTQVTDIGGRTWQFTESSSGFSLRRPGSTSDNVTVTKDASGVTAVTADGVTTSYSRSVSGSAATTTTTDALQHQRSVVSDLSIGRPTRVTDELGQATGFAYDGNGRLTGVTAPEGNQVLTAYDARGNVSSTTVRAKPDSGLADIVTTAGYEAGCANAATCNQPVWTRDAAGNQTDYAYDAATGHVTSVTAPAATNGIRPQTRYAYGSVSGVSVLTGTSACQTGASCTGTADELRTTIGYNANLLPETVSTGAGDGSLTATQTATYTPLGDVETVDGPLPGPTDTSRAFYNASREMVGVIGPDPDGAGPLRNRAQRIERNADGDPTSIIGGTASGQSDAAFAGMASLEATRIGYDAGRRKVYESHDSGVVTDIAQWSYDAAGRPDCAAVRMNRDVYWSLPASACQLGVQGAEGPDRITRTLYDAAGRPTVRIVALGTADEAREVTASYTPNGQLERLTDGEGNRTGYAYDGFDRLSRTFYPVAAVGADTSNPNDYEDLSHDARGLVTLRQLRDGQVIGLGYDALGRPVSKSVPGEPQVTFAYDSLGHLLAANKAGGAPGSVSFTYDALGRRLTDSGAGGTVSFRYDLADRRTVMTDPLGFDVTYDYLVTGEMTLIGEFGARSGGGVLAAFDYDDRGRRTSLSRGGGATETRYAYDPASRLSSMTHDLQGASADLSIGFSYNPASQIVSRTSSNDAYAFTPGAGSTSYAANGLNQLTRTGSAAPTFDARGNMTSDGSNAFGYSAENRMTNLTVAGQAPVALAYDALGRLIGAGGSRLDYDGDEPILERDAGGNFVRRHVWGPGSDELIAWYEGGAGRRFVATDERGSLIAVTNNEGYPIAIDRYDEYGNGAPGNWGAIQYTGQMRLGPVYHYKNRDYHPGPGRFLQTDPIGYGDGMNPYAYVGADPVNFTDPSGLGGCPGTRGVDYDVCGKRPKPEPHVTITDATNSGNDGESGGPAGTPSVRKPVVPKPKPCEGHIQTAQQAEEIGSYLGHVGEGLGLAAKATIFIPELSAGLAIASGVATLTSAGFNAYGGYQRARAGDSLGARLSGVSLLASGISGAGGIKGDVGKMLKGASLDVAKDVALKARKGPC